MLRHICRHNAGDLKLVRRIRRLILRRLVNGDDLLAAIAIGEVADDLHPLAQFIIGGVVQNRDMNERVRRSVCGGNEAESLCFIKKFYGRRNIFPNGPVWLAIIHPTGTSFLPNLAARTRSGSRTSLSMGFLSDHGGAVCSDLRAAPSPQFILSGEALTRAGDTPFDEAGNLRARADGAGIMHPAQAARFPLPYMQNLRHINSGMRPVGGKKPDDDERPRSVALRPQPVGEIGRLTQK